MLLALASAARADEFSMIGDSSVLGRNAGYPSGTPSQGHTPVGAVDLVLEPVAFTKNLERLGRIPGETFIGFLLPVRLRVRPHERFHLELGAALAHDFGEDDAFARTDPLLRMVWEPAEEVFFVGGTLIPTHWIHDAILDDVQKLREATEQGFQLRADRERLQLDSWINWRVSESALRPEKFEVGASLRLRPDPRRALWLEGHFLWDHIGGQRNASMRIEHNLAAAASASYGFESPFGVAAVEELRLGGSVFKSSDDTNRTRAVTGEGWEAFGRLDAPVHPRARLRLHGGYFRGDRFLARRGAPDYGLDSFGQAGATLLARILPDLRLEFGLGAKFTSGEVSAQYQVNFVWGHAFAIDFLRPRPAGGRL